MRKVLLLLSLCSASVFAAEQTFDTTAAKIKAAQQSSLRSEAEILRDKNRKPVKTLKFLGLHESMTVVELLPGGGWYSKLLAPTLAENGSFIVAMGAGRMVKGMAGKAGLTKMAHDGTDFSPHKPKGARFYTMKSATLKVDDADMVLTFRNYHNFDAEGRMAMNKAAFAALKRGGIYGVVDHTRRHMESDSPENGRRVDPTLAIKEIQAAGFEFVDYSDLHYRADDELRYEVGRKTVTGNTDRFTFKFKKPE